MIVVDADVLAYFWLEQASQRTDRARRARRKDPDWNSPILWRSEFRNILRGYLNMEALSLGEAMWYADKAERDMRGHEHEVVTADVLRLVEQTGHSSYDCEYVSLARSLAVPLITGDRLLPRLFPETAILLEDYTFA